MIFKKNDPLPYWKGGVDEAKKEALVVAALPSIGANDPSKAINVRTFFDDQEPCPVETLKPVSLAFAEQAAKLADEKWFDQGLAEEGSLGR